jgi:hypothetical protein
LPGTNAPKLAGCPRVSARVGGTLPPTVTARQGGIVPASRSYTVDVSEGVRRHAGLHVPGRQRVTRHAAELRRRSPEQPGGREIRARLLGQEHLTSVGSSDSPLSLLIADRVWRTRSQLELAIVEYLGWFNHDRLHESLGDIPPAEFEAGHAPRLLSEVHK